MSSGNPSLKNPNEERIQGLHAECVNLVLDGDTKGFERKKAQLAELGAPIGTEQERLYRKRLARVLDGKV